MAETQDTPKLQDTNGQSDDPNIPDLNIERLHSLPSEQQELYLLTYTSDLVRHVATLDAEQATEHQAAIKKELIKVVTLSSPNPSRVIRSNLGKCFAGIYSKGERKTLFETINELVGYLNPVKGEKDYNCRHVAVYVLGVVFETAGDSALSLSPLAATTCLRQLKIAQNNAGFRGAIVKALGQIVGGVGKSFDETIARDLWKQLRPMLLNEKSNLVQKNACWALSQLCSSTTYFDNSNDFDKLQQVLGKAMDNASPAIRRAAASCLSTIYVKNYSSVALAAQPKKKSKPKPTPDADGDETEQRPDSPNTAPAPRSLVFGIVDIFRALTTLYCRSSTTNRVRAAVVITCIKVVQALGESVMEDQYEKIALHLLNELLSSPSIVHNRYRLLITRRFVHIILADVIGKKLLGESAQMNAARLLINGVLKDWPQPEIKERTEPTKEALIGALDALTGLIQNLGSAMNSLAELCRGALLQVLEHPSHTVQIYAGKCLQAFTFACPHQLLPCAMICLNSTTREVGQLSTPRRSPRRCIGFSRGLAAVMSTATSHPLYGSAEVYGRVFQQATNILKSSSGSDLRVSSTQIQVAWTMISSLMSLGPNFVKVHLSQILLLWRNALPKPLKDDNIGKRGLLELSFLAHVRECALSSIRAFLEFNGRLLTVDVTKRIAGMLQNTVEFLNILPDNKATEDMGKRLSQSLQLQDFEIMVRRRVFDSYFQLLQLSPAAAQDTLLQSGLLSFATSTFADPETMSSSSLSTSIATSSGNFESIWDVGDNSGFGISSLVNGHCVTPFWSRNESSEVHWLVENSNEDVIDRIIHLPVCSSHEHDPIFLSFDPLADLHPPPIATDVVDSSIRLFALALLAHSQKVQQGTLEQMRALLSADSTLRSPAKEAAVTVNTALALFYTLDLATKDTPVISGTLHSPRVEKALQELLHVSSLVAINLQNANSEKGFLKSQDETVRFLAAESLGRLCKSAGNDFSSKEIGQLIDMIVADREPGVRSACAMALGSISAELGGMAAGVHLKNVLGVLTSLASDAHPVVHFWALDALAKVSESVGLAFAGHVSGTIGTLAQLYVAETHGEDAATWSFSNHELDRPTTAALARCVNSMVNVSGPELQDMNKLRSMILTLVYQFQTEDSSLTICESMKSTENLLMYAPNHISFQPYVRQLENRMISEHPGIRNTALLRLYNTMRRGAEDTMRAGDSHLEERLWIALNDSYGQGLPQRAIHDWVQQSGLENIGEWIHRIQQILTKVQPGHKRNPTTEQAPRSAAPQSAAELDVADEDVAGFVASASQTAKDDPNQPSASSQELIRWQVRAVAMDCLNDILSDVNEDSEELDILQPRVADIVKIAFAASTASIVELRVAGIKIIGKILQLFGRLPDPDFPEVTLLEQYQAQISSALTPAFAVDSSPPLAAEAIGVCASFISTGIVTQVERMGRILKLLTSSLDEYSQNEAASSIGDLKGLSSNAQIMVRLAVFSAWAELQSASREQKYLEGVVQPHLRKLTPLWLSSLREFARLKFEPDISIASAGISIGSEDTYASLSRETLLEFYQESWLNIVDAIASLIDQDSEFVFDALDDKVEDAKQNDENKDDGKIKSKGNEINYRDEPVAFFFVLFGITFEALASRSSNTSAMSQRRTLDTLYAVKKIVGPSVAGLAIYQDVTFTETMDLFDRMVLTEGLEVQTVIVEIAHELLNSHPAARRSQEDEANEESLSDDIDQLFELTRIIVLVISKHVPNMGAVESQARSALTQPVIDLIFVSLTALVSASHAFPTIIKSDLHACVLHTFTTILATGACQQMLVPQILPVFRKFVNGITSEPTRNPTENQTLLRTALARFLSILSHAQRRENEAAIPCERNTLLAGTILVTSATSAFAAGDPLISRWIDAVADCLTNRLTTKFAAGLSRSLLLLAFQKNASSSEAGVAAGILPYLIQFLKEPSEVEDTDAARSIVAQALVNFVQSAPATSSRANSLSLVLTTLVERAKEEGESVYKETSARILELAGADQQGFRYCVGELPADDRGLMQEIVRQWGGMSASGGSRGRSGTSDGGDQKDEPTIALKMDF